MTHPHQTLDCYKVELLERMASALERSAAALEHISKHTTPRIGSVAWEVGQPTDETQTPNKE